MPISDVSKKTILLLVVFLSGLAAIRHVAVAPSCSGRTTNSEGHVITKGLDPRHSRFTTTVKKAERTQLGMAQAASEVKHGTANEAGEYGTTAENKETRSGSSFDESKMTYKDAKERVGEAYRTARETMTESAKIEYEDAKEKASKAAGDLGAKMREEKEEL